MVSAGGGGGNPQHPMGGGGGPGVPGGGGPGGPGGPGGAVPATVPIPQAPIQPATNIRLMGTPPRIFTGNQVEANIFLNEFQRYVRVNCGVPGFESPTRLVALTLTYIQGPTVANWAREMGQWIDGLDPILDNIPDVLRQFYDEFRAQYADSQQQQRARQKLDTLKMINGEINTYNVKFEDQCQLAGYMVRNEETVYTYMRGLTPMCQRDVLQSPTVHTYPEIKQRAINLDKAQQLIDSLSRRNTNFWFQNFQNSF